MPFLLQRKVVRDGVDLVGFRVIEQFIVLGGIFWGLTLLRVVERGGRGARVGLGVVEEDMFGEEAVLFEVLIFGKLHGL